MRKRPRTRKANSPTRMTAFKKVLLDFVTLLRYFYSCSCMRAWSCLLILSFCRRFLIFLSWLSVSMNMLSDMHFSSWVFLIRLLVDGEDSLVHEEFIVVRHLLVGVVLLLKTLLRGEALLGVGEVGGFGPMESPLNVENHFVVAPRLVSFYSQLLVVALEVVDQLVDLWDVLVLDGHPELGLEPLVVKENVVDFPDRPQESFLHAII